MRITMALVAIIFCNLALSKEQDQSTMAEDFSNYLGDNCLPSGHNGGKYSSNHNRNLCALTTTSSPILSIISSVLLTTDTTINGINQLITLAKPDAYAYIGSNGKQYHTARLERAFQYIRKTYPNATNIEMAQAIIAY